MKWLPIHGIGRRITRMVINNNRDGTRPYLWPKQERDGVSPNASPMSLDQIKIRELEKKIRYIEEEKEILKKATEISTVLLLSDSMINSR
jgi:hypothetical protein